jgi:nitrite reductase (NO-forming)
MSKLYFSFRKNFFAIMLLVLLFGSSCVPVVQMQSPSQEIHSDKPAKDQLVPVKNTMLGTPTIFFTLKTGMADGKMVFFGESENLEGKVNPDLLVEPGDIIEITLINGDGALHDLSLGDLGVATEQIAGQGKKTTLTFQAKEVGIFAYFCSVPGHRQAGMEGRLVVGKPEAQEEVTTSVVRRADDLPGPLNRTVSKKIQVDLETVEVEAKLTDGTSFVFWTFNGKVPGPFIRVRVGDTVEVHLKNSAGSQMSHSVDFHAVTGPGGGAVATQTKPGEETSFTFKAMNPGLFVYHCATPMVAQHIANGMYGMILVEPEEGLPAVDREFYVMQGEIYTTEEMGSKGLNSFSVKKLLDEDPEYFILNGAVGALTKDSPLKANTGETVRIFFGVGGPNFPSSFHVIGEIFDRVFDLGSLTAAPLTNVQTTLVPPGGAAMVEFKLEVPGRYILVDHALSRMERGLAGYLLVEGPDNHEIFDGKMTPGSGH